MRDRMPICDFGTNFFACPPGWEEEAVEGGRRVKKRWVQRGDDGDVQRVFDRRADLEDSLEAEAESLGAKPWLGQLVRGEWQIDSRRAPRAIQYVLGVLESLGLVACLQPEKIGKAYPMYIVCNRYWKGEPFPKPPVERKARRRAPVEEEEGEEDLADIEIERRKNIERNQEILRQLGLA